MAFSELESLNQLSDFNLRKYVLDLIDLKHKIQKELEFESLSVDRETSLKDALKMVDDNLTNLRLEGLM